MTLPVFSTAIAATHRRHNAREYRALVLKQALKNPKSKSDCREYLQRTYIFMQQLLWEKLDVVFLNDVCVVTIGLESAITMLHKDDVL